MDLDLDNSDLVARARALAAQRAEEMGRPDLADDAALVTSELVTNATLHGGGCTGVDIRPLEGGLRVEVADRSAAPPVYGHASEASLTGRGVRVIAHLAAAWGVDAARHGKVVWAEITGRRHEQDLSVSADHLLAMWGEEWDIDADEPRYRIELGSVPTELLLAAKSHVDNVVREFTLAVAGADAGVTGKVPAHLAELLAVIERFGDARRAIKRQALDAAGRGAVVTSLTVDLPARAADDAEAYLHALDEVDTYCRAMRLLTLETPPQHRLFRQWYVGELVAQLRAVARGGTPPPVQPFDQRVLAELDRVTAAQRASERAARLYSLAAALATAATAEEVAAAVLKEGVAALGAAAGGLLLATDEDRLALPAAVGYDEAVLERLRSESRDAELPAAVALRTGEAVWLESRVERDTRFPELAGMEVRTVSLCAVPLEVQGRRLGALRFSFVEPRLFDEDERRFVLTLAAQTAQALERTQLHDARVDASRRLQRSLLPRELPRIPGVEVAAVYRPFGDGMELGGDFYDVWQVGPQRWAVAVGDASGTGPEAAAMTALVRHSLRALTLTEDDPELVVRRLNTVLYAEADPDAERFCTVVFGVLDTSQATELRLASGGHPPVFVARGGGVEPVHVGGSLLGCFPDADVATARVVLGRGDTVLFVTDGVLEARRDGVLFDTAGVEAVLCSGVTGVDGMAGAVEAAVLQHAGGSLADDMAAVVLRKV